MANLTNQEIINDFPWFYGIYFGTREIGFTIMKDPWRFMPPVGFTGELLFHDGKKDSAIYLVNSDGSGNVFPQTYFVPSTPPVNYLPGYLRLFALQQASPLPNVLAAINLTGLPVLQTVTYSEQSLNYYWTISNTGATETNPVFLLLRGFGG
jgi:hypothetical protein